MPDTIPTDLIPSRVAKVYSEHGTSWGFVRWARQLGLHEYVREGSARLYWSKAEILKRCFREKKAAS